MPRVVSHSCPRSGMGFCDGRDVGLALFGVGGSVRRRSRRSPGLLARFCQNGGMTQPSADRPSPEPLAENVQVRWPDDTGTDSVAVNQVLFSFDQAITDVVYMYVGHVAPPPWPSSEIAHERLAANSNTLQIVPKGSFVMSRTNAEDLWQALGRHLGKLPQ